MIIDKENLTIHGVQFKSEELFNKVMLKLAMEHEDGYEPTKVVVEKLRDKHSEN